jgi:GNAT superfamily N-acetyltransferase
VPVALRPFQEADVSAAGAIAGAMQPPYLAEDGMTLWQEAYRVAANRFCLAAWYDGAVTGCGALWRLRADRFRVDLMVHPQWQRRGVGGALWRRLSEEARQRGAARIQARARDDRPAALSFLQNRGFIETQRMDRFLICPAEADLQKLRAAIERVEQRRVALTTLAAALVEDADCLRKLHSLFLAVIPDWPDPDPDSVEPPSFSDFLRLLDPLASTAETLLLATVDDRLVGFCGSLGTAVHPAYRGWGIATALEARVIERAHSEGHDRLFGQSANPAMQSVYAKLGYRPSFSEVRLVRRLEVTAP